MTDQSLPEQPTIDTVVRSFTQSELALADVTRAIAKFQTASERLASAEAGTTAAADALRSATEASGEIAKILRRVSAGLDDAVAEIRAVDPVRLWAHLEASDRRHEATDSQTAKSLTHLDHRLTLLFAQVEASDRRHEATDSQTAASLARLDRQLTLLLWVGSLAALAAVGALLVEGFLATRAT